MFQGFNLSVIVIQNNLARLVWCDITGARAPPWCRFFSATRLRDPTTTRDVRQQHGGQGDSSDTAFD